MIAAADDRSYVGLPAETHVDGQPMPSYLAAHADWQQKKVREVRRYRVVNKLTIEKACKLADVSVRWYHYHRDQIERPTVSLASAS